LIWIGQRPERSPDVARSIWSGSISFGLVNIPVKLFSAVKDKDVHFHMLHRVDGARVQQKLVCPADGKEVPRNEVVKGYEFAPDRYVTVQSEELEGLAPKASRTIEIQDFVNLVEIDPTYYDRPYYLAPDKHSEKAYHLLVEAMARSQKVALARFVMREKEYLAALRPDGSSGILLLETMRFADEITPVREIESEAEIDGGGPKVSDRELSVAQQLIDSLTSEFEPEKYRDDYRDRVLTLLDQKVKGEEVVLPPAPEEPSRVIDLVSALEASLAEAKQRKKETKARQTA
jgi:DNA end-binding protein Ku